MISVAAVTDLSGNDVVVVVVTTAGSGVASVEAGTGDGDGGGLTNSSEVVSGVGGVEAHSLEITLTPSVGDAVAATIFASSGVATFVDVAAGVGELVGLDGAADVVEDLGGCANTSVVGEVETVLVLAGEGGAVTAAGGGAAVTGGAEEALSDMFELEFNELVCGSFGGVVVAIAGLAWTVFSGGVTVVVAEVGLGEIWDTGEVEVTEAVVDVGEACRKSFTAVVTVVVREFTVVVAATVAGGDVVDVEGDGVTLLT